MRRDDFKQATMEFDMLLDNNKLKYKYDYEGQDPEDIFKLCRKLTRSNIEENKKIYEPVNENSLKPYFIKSIKIFNNQRIVDYFENKFVKIKRDKNTTDQESGLEIDYDNKRKTEYYKLYLPKGNLFMTNQMGFAHEMGHIPQLEKPREDYLEYSEALPIFMEYLVSLRKNGTHEEALNYFLKERLPMQQEDAKDLLKMFKRLKEKDYYVSLYHKQLFADCYKFIESLEYSLGLIERMNDDKEAVSDEIEKVLKGKSLIKVAENLDIKTDGCERLQKEFKRMSR